MTPCQRDFLHVAKEKFNKNSVIKKEAYWHIGLECRIISYFHMSFSFLADASQCKLCCLPFDINAIATGYG